MTMGFEVQVGKWFDSDRFDDVAKARLRRGTATNVLLLL